MDVKWINVLNVHVNTFKVTIKKPERRQLTFNPLIHKLLKWPVTHLKNLAANVTS